MNAIEIIFAVVLILVCAVIIAFTLMQEPKGRGLSGAITGDASSMIGAGRDLYDRGTGGLHCERSHGLRLKICKKDRRFAFLASRLFFCVKSRNNKNQ